MDSWFCAWHILVPANKLFFCCMLVVCSFTTHAYIHNAYPLYTGQQLTLGFTQVDFREGEGNGSVTVTVEKRGANAGTLVVTVTPLTYDGFDSMGFTQPSEVQRASDPAECKYKHLEFCYVAIVTKFSFPGTCLTQINMQAIP